MPATKVVVNIPDEQPYNVRIGEGILADLGNTLNATPSLNQVTRYLIISDSNVSPLYLKACKESLAAAGIKSCDISIPAGEDSKSLNVATEIWEAMALLKLNRDCAVIALGGGVVGDLAGFVGSTYMRGLPIVQVPTTLLSMVDSSVGGKTGVNLAAGKNLVGTFTQPRYVCADTSTLATLDDREWQCGCGEIAKSALIDSDDFFFWLLEHATELANRETAVVNEAIVRCVIFKANVVSADKTESKGVRECLNYGHTLGHAIEKLTGYGTYSHGACVAEGMRFAAQLAKRLVGCPEELVYTQGELLDTLNLPPLDWCAAPEAILEVMKNDKKTRDGHVRFVLPRDVGDWVIEDVADSVILEELEAWALTKGTA